MLAYVASSRTKVNYYSDHSELPKWNVRGVSAIGMNLWKTCVNVPDLLINVRDRLETFLSVNRIILLPNLLLTMSAIPHQKIEMPNS